jgi:hypothetical protein
VKFGNGDLMKTCRDIQNLVKTVQKYRTLYAKTSVRFIVAGDIKSSHKLSRRVRLYQAVRMAEEVKVLRIATKITYYVRFTSLPLLRVVLCEWRFINRHIAPSRSPIKYAKIYSLAVYSLIVRISTMFNIKNFYLMPTRCV